MLTFKCPHSKTTYDFTTYFARSSLPMPLSTPLTRYVNDQGFLVSSYQEWTCSDVCMDLLKGYYFKNLYRAIHIDLKSF